MSEVRTRANVLLQEATKPSLDEIGSTLREFGLTGYAADAFCALARFASASAGELVRTTGIPDSKIYYALDELAEKGLVEVQEGKPKAYRVVPPREIEARLARWLEARHDRERAALTRVVSLIEPLRAATKSPETDLAYIVKGLQNVLARVRSMIVSARKEIVFLISDESVLRRIEPDLVEALGRRVRVRLATSEIPLDSVLAKRAEIRAIVCSCIILVIDGQQVLTVTRTSEDTAYGILSTDETLVALGLEYWESPRCCVES